MKNLYLISFFLMIFTLSAFPQTPAPQSTPASITPDAQKAIDQNTPAALPQTPAAKKDTSDAQDDNIRGKVKTVLSESEIVGRVGSRRITSIEDFDEHGNRLKQISLNSEGDPRQISVYGYIDRARVSKSMYISYAYDPPPPPAPLRPRNAPPEPPRDHRYETKYEYTYKNGKMTEEIRYANSGKLVTRVVYNWTGDNQVEELIFDSRGELNRKYVRTYDKAGKEIEKFSPDTIPGKPYGDTRSVTRYDAFDTAGNWTKKTVVMYRVSDNGTAAERSTYITYRTISYYK